ncbi:brain protein I3-like [Penaeus monodon]|uniref:brain protein I3-like n=1 Tax=Penaeus monodon TaxID=6687 RepID=UPI0018A7D490|nr:brain protein I3-like [Penaeus monodon]
MDNLAFELQVGDESDGLPPPPPDPYLLPAEPSVTGPVLTISPGQCPGCRVGRLQKEYTRSGIALAIGCFPCGIACCRSMRKFRCNRCKALF